MPENPLVDADLTKIAKEDGLGDELNKRNFYLSLFNIYSAIPIGECLHSFSKIFNDVFVMEKPLNVQKYFLTECMVVEMNEPYDDVSDYMPETHEIAFRFNFATNTSKEVNYSKNVHFQNFLNRAIRVVKKHDINLGEKLDLHKRGRKTNGQ